MNEITYGTDPIKKLLLKLAIPGIITMIVGSINMIVDGIFMGNFIGSDALAAVNLVMPAAMIVFALSDLIASGAGVRVGILLGEGDLKEASRTFSVSVLLLFIINVFVAVAAFLFAEQIIFALIADTTLAQMAWDYIKVFIFALPLIGPLFALDNFLLACGKAKTSMFINIAVSVLNIALNTYFIAYLGLGISFAALSTAISMVVGSLLSLIPFLRGTLALRFAKPVIPFKTLGRILYNGSSKFLEGISGSIMGIITNGLMLHLAGGDGVAAMSIVTYAEIIFFPILMGVIGAAQPLVSYNHGANKPERVREVFKLVSIASAVISFAVMIPMLLFPEFFVGLFSAKGTEEMKELATFGLLLYAPSFIFTWFNLVVSTFLTAFEKPMESMILMILEAVVLPIAFFIALSTFMGVYGMFLAQTAAAACTTVAALILWKKAKINVLKMSQSA